MPYLARALRLTVGEVTSALMSNGAQTLWAVITPRDLLGASTIVASASSPCVSTSAARTSLARANAESLRRSYASTTSDEPAAAQRRLVLASPQRRGVRGRVARVHDTRPRGPSQRIRVLRVVEHER